MNAPQIDHTKLESFVTRAVGDLSAAYGGVMVSLGSKLGLYKAMQGAGPLAPGSLPPARAAPSGTYASG